MPSSWSLAEASPLGRCHLAVLTHRSRLVPRWRTLPDHRYWSSIPLLIGAAPVDPPLETCERTSEFAAALKEGRAPLGESEFYRLSRAAPSRWSPATLECRREALLRRSTEINLAIVLMQHPPSHHLAEVLQPRVPVAAHACHCLAASLKPRSSCCYCCSSPCGGGSSCCYCHPIESCCPLPLTHVVAALQPWCWTHYPVPCWNLCHQSSEITTIAGAEVQLDRREGEENENCLPVCNLDISLATGASSLELPSHSHRGLQPLITRNHPRHRSKSPHGGTREKKWRRRKLGPIYLFAWSA